MKPGANRKIFLSSNNSFPFVNSKRLGPKISSEPSTSNEVSETDRKSPLNERRLERVGDDDMKRNYGCASEHYECSYIGVGVT